MTNRKCPKCDSTLMYGKSIKVEVCTLFLHMGIIPDIKHADVEFFIWICRGCSAIFYNTRDYQELIEYSLRRKRSE